MGRFKVGVEYDNLQKRLEDALASNATLRARNQVLKEENETIRSQAHTAIWRLKEARDTIDRLRRIIQDNTPMVI